MTCKIPIALGIATSCKCSQTVNYRVRLNNNRFHLCTSSQNQRLAEVGRDLQILPCPTPHFPAS